MCQQLRVYFIFLSSVILYNFYMSARLGKQLLYGFMYLVLLGAVAWGIYFVALRPAPTCFDNRQNQGETGIDCGGPCIPCEIKNLRPLSASQAVLYSADRLFSISAQVTNPNINFGAKSFGYSIDIYDGSGNLLRTINNTSFLYPGETKNIIEAGIRIATGIPARADFKLNAESIVWESPEEFFRPSVELKDVNVSVERDQVVVNGSAANLNNYIVSRLTVNAFLVDNTGKRVGASKTVLNNIGAFRVESFRIFIPADREVLETVDAEATGRSVFMEILK